MKQTSGARRTGPLLTNRARANSNYASNEYFLPVMRLIFLRRAFSRFERVKAQVEPTLPRRSGRARELRKEDFSGRRAIFLAPEARFDYLIELPGGRNLAHAIVHAMESIEADYEALKGVLPKQEYQESSITMSCANCYKRSTTPVLNRALSPSTITI